MKSFLFVVLGFFALGGVLSQELVLNYSVEKQVIDAHPKLKELQGVDLGEEKYTEFSTLKLFDEFSIWERDSFKVSFDNTSLPFKHIMRPEITIKHFGMQNIFYHNPQFDGKLQITLTDSEKKLDWKIDRNKRKKILGIECVYASCVIEGTFGSGKIEVWYTEDIPYPDCPIEDYAFQLPGLILEVYNKALNKHLIATAINIRPKIESHRKFSDFEILPSYDVDERNAFYMSLDRSSPYILSEQTPQNVWLPYPKE